MCSALKDRRKLQLTLTLNRIRSLSNNFPLKQRLSLITEDLKRSHFFNAATEAHTALFGGPPESTAFRLPRQQPWNGDFAAPQNHHQATSTRDASHTSRFELSAPRTRKALPFIPHTNIHGVHVRPTQLLVIENDVARPKWTFKARAARQDKRGAKVPLRSERKR